MDALVSQLIEVLEQQIKLYKDLLMVSQNKTKIIIEGKVAELEKLVRLEQSLVLQVGSFEDKREKIIRQVAEAINKKSEELTLTQLITELPKAQGGQLKDQQGQLVETVTELKHTNEQNAKLIQNSLEYINFSLNLFASAEGSDNNYGVGAEKVAPKSKNIFDTKI